MTTLSDRFDDDAILDALLRQRVVSNDRELAEQFARKGRKKAFSAGEVLIEQGAWDDELHFILAGEFELLINGQHKAVRQAGVHVGELAGVNAARPRSATLRALGDAMVLTVDAADAREIADKNPAVYKAMLEVAGERLDQRNAEIGAANDYPRVFVISSSEGLDVARLVRRHLDQDDKIAVKVWDQGTFTVSDFALSSIEDAIEAADFTIAVVRADDGLVTRGRETKTARDNVHLEYGISIGRLGRDRSFLLVDVAEDVKLPSDIAGITTLRYRSGRSKDDLDRSVAKACDVARDLIEFAGVRRDRRAC